MVVVIEQVRKVDVEGVGVAVPRPEGFLVLVGRGELDGGILRYIISGEAVEAVVALTVVLKTAFDLELDAVHHRPVERRVGVPGGTDALGVVVGHGKEGRCVVAVVLLLVGALDGRCDGDGGVGDGVLETAVAGGAAGVVDAVGACSADVGPGVADVGVDGSGLRGLEVALEVEVVTGVGGTLHDGVVAHVGVAEGPVEVLSAAGDGSVGAVGGSHVAEHHSHPIVALEAAVEVDVAETAEVRHVVGADVVADGGELILELHEVLGIHRDDGVLVGHHLASVVAVELHADLLALLRALGGHDDDAVRTAATVDGRGECVLEDVDARDLGRGDVVDGFHGEAVDDVERAVVLGDGAAAAHADLDVGVRVAFSSDDRHAGHLAGKCLADGCHRLLGELL